MTKKTLIDLSYIKDTRFSGVGMVGLNILKGFNKYNGQIEIFVLSIDYMVPFIQQQTSFPGPYISITFKEWRKSLYFLFNPFSVPFLSKIIDLHIDTILCPYVDHRFFVMPKPFRQFVIVHDLIMLSSGGGKSLFRRCIDRFYYKILFRKVYRIISISKTTRDSLFDFCGVDSTVIYNSIVSSETSRVCPSDFFIKSPYILDVNAFRKYKNGDLLIHAFNDIKNDIPHVLVMKGGIGGPYLSQLKALVKSLGLEDRVLFYTTNVNEKELNYLYSNSSLCVSPSLMEGFGFTPIEAVLQGADVLVSDIKPLEEVSMGLLPSFSASSKKDLKKKILEILHSPVSDKCKEKRKQIFREKYSLDNQCKELICLLYNI